ncbi:putative nuclease HARBI1 [Ischnura elegans]|uniref:putative nuclease HARBI1 n=1 Tax=Ischnura elegans TaxID=197161 RepID=UPI001ED8818E|nr:putative nuclease HARBI1 [Ischnura elegans]
MRGVSGRRCSIPVVTSRAVQERVLAAAERKETSSRFLGAGLRGAGGREASAPRHAFYLPRVGTRKFREAHGIKGIIGCIDCTQIAIVRPHIREEAYFNYKGFHSLNVQAVSSDDLVILSLNTRFPGTIHDSFIWRQSAIRQEMVGLWDNGNKDSMLLGDSGYPLEPWLMTPILDAAEGSSEARYTRAHSQTRNCVERMFGVLKNTFRCLLRHRVLHYQPPVVSAIIVACAVLHNMRIHHNVMDRVDVGDVQPDVNERLEDNNGVVRGERVAEAERVRAMLVRHF